MPSASAVVVMLVAFAITFVLVRVITKWFRRRDAQRGEAQQRSAESRQVRRARERRGDR